MPLTFFLAFAQNHLCILKVVYFNISIFAVCFPICCSIERKSQLPQSSSVTGEQLSQSSHKKSVSVTANPFGKLTCKVQYGDSDGSCHDSPIRMLTIVTPTA